MPVKARTGMLTTGMRTPIGLKIAGADLATIDRIGVQVEAILSPIGGARRVFAERMASTAATTHPGVESEVHHEDPP
jgi:Cu(I)/Ag(I) efflux system membrane protein CusA/SilA